MKVTQEKLPASQIGLEIEVTPEMSKKAYEQVIQEFTRSANIPGFRKGKVPRPVLVRQFGATRLKAAALEELIDSSLREALKQQEIEAIGNFQLRSSFEDLVQQFEPGSSLTFLAAVDVQPEVTLNQYTGLSLKAEEIKPDPDRVDKVLEQYRQQVATLIPVEGRAAQLGDVAVVDYVGRYVTDEASGETEEVPGGKADNFQIEMDEERFIPGFVSGIVGMNPGETREISVQFPDEYPQETLAGKPATFTITLKELKERELPELDDDFAQEVSEFQTLEELRQSLTDRYTKEADDRTASNKEKAILDELVQQVEVDLPETLINREVEYMLTQTAMQLQNQGMDIRQLFNQETIPMLKDRSRPEAIDRIKRTLALGEIAKRESIEVDAAAVNARVRELREQFADQDIDLDRLQSVVTEDLLKEKILQWVEEHSTLELVPEGSLKPAEPEAEAAPTVEEEATPASEATLDVAATEVVAEAEPVASVEEPETPPEAGKKTRKAKADKSGDKS